MSNKEEMDEANEILYGKKNTKPVTAEKSENGKSSGDDLTDEILYGKRKTKVAGEPKVKSGGDELMDEILYGKKKPKKTEGEPSEKKDKTDGEELMDEILYGKKKGKKTAEKAESEDAPQKKGKKFDREEYFGL